MYTLTTIGCEDIWEGLFNLLPIAGEANGGFIVILRKSGQLDTPFDLDTGFLDVIAEDFFQSGLAEDDGNALRTKQMQNSTR